MFIMASSIPNNRVSSSNACLCLLMCRMWCWRAAKWFPVVLIICVLAWSYYAYVIQLCIFTVESVVQQCIYLVLYHVSLIMLTWSYWRTIFAEIEPIPEKFKLPPAELEKLVAAESEDAQRQLLDNFAKDLPMVTRTMSGAVRYCNRCVLAKPDRAHHCSICSRCVLKMDHHCPWVNNCVCFHNYKFFVLFLTYALVYCLLIAGSCLPYFVQFWKVQGEFGTGSGPGRYHVMFAFFVSLMFAISLGSLFVYHCYLLVKNRTTLDSLLTFKNRPATQRLFQRVFKDFADEAFRAPMFRGGADKNGFSLGCYKNFKEVFGHNPKLWLLPVFTSAGDGCAYPVRREHEQAAPAPIDAQGYESMGTTRSSYGDGIVYPQPHQDEDAESLLSSGRWDRWDERALPFDDADSDLSCDNIEV